MKIKKFACLLIVVVLCVSLIVGCTSQDKTNENDSKQSSTQNNESKQEKPKEVTLRFMWWGRSPSSGNTRGYRLVSKE